MGKKKGKIGKKSILTSLLKVTGDLSEDRLNTLLFGYDFNNQESDEEDSSGISCDTGRNIVKKMRRIEPQTKLFSDMLVERAASPMVSPRLGLRSVLDHLRE